MIDKLRQQAGLIIRGLNLLKGERRLKIINVNSDPNEAYHVSTNNGGLVTIHCTETIYEIVYSSWWVKNKKHYSYTVYAVCNEMIPQEFGKLISKGFHIGRLLPHWANPIDQKKAAIHAFMSMIAEEASKRIH